MVKRDRNRPCIFIWGVGNEVENQGQKGMLDTLEMLTAYVKGLDASRPVTYAKMCIRDRINTLVEEAKEKLCIIVSHDYDLKKYCDKIIELAPAG